MILSVPRTYKLSNRQIYISHQQLYEQFTEAVVRKSSEKPPSTVVLQNRCS